MSVEVSVQLFSNREVILENSYIYNEYRKHYKQTSNLRESGEKL